MARRRQFRLGHRARRGRRGGGGGRNGSGDVVQAEAGLVEADRHARDAEGSQGECHRQARRQEEVREGEERAVLRQGDAISTDVAGSAEIDYTDGSLTRLGVSTNFTITKLTTKRGGRQTQGIADARQHLESRGKVTQTGSFEVKAGGTTAAVEGTAFAMTCKIDNGHRVCKVIDVVDNVRSRPVPVGSRS